MKNNEINDYYPKKTSLEARRRVILIGLMVLIGVFFISPSDAEVQTLGTVSIGNCVDLPQSYYNSTYSNITSIQYPNKTIIEMNISMQKRGKGYYVYRFCNTTQLGEYIVNTITDVDGIFTRASYNFYVGNSIFLTLIILIGGFVILSLAIFLKSEWYGFISGNLFLMAGIQILIYGLGFSNDLYSQTVGYTSLTLGLCLMFISIFELFISYDGGNDES